MTEMQQGAKSATAPPTKLASKLVPIRTSRTHRSYYSMSGPRAARATLYRVRGGVMRKLFAVVAVLLIAAVVVVVGLMASNSSSPLTVKDRGAVKPFTLPNVRDGDPAVSLGQSPGRPVVMNFWATWCIPCRRELPGFEAVHERLGNRVRF